MKGGGSGQFAATAYNMTAVWVEKQRQKILQKLGTDATEADVLKELRPIVESELRLNYLVTGSQVFLHMSKA